MADNKKQSNADMFYRAGQALGGSKAPSRGFDYSKGISEAFAGANALDAAESKSRELRKSSPDGLYLEKLTEGQTEEVTNYIKETIQQYRDQKELLENGTTEQKEAATTFINNYEKSIVQLNADFEGSKQKRLQLEGMLGEGGNYALSNTAAQKLAAESFYNGDLEKTSKIVVGENGIARLTLGGQVWDTIDTGTGYDNALGDSIDNLEREIRGLGTDGKVWDKQATRDMLRKAARDPKAIKDLMFQEPQLMNAFVSSQVGIPMQIEQDGKMIENPDWVKFTGGATLSDLGMKSSKAGGIFSTYKTFFELNKTDIDFSDGFVDITMNMLQNQYDNPPTLESSKGDGFDADAHEA